MKKTTLFIFAILASFAMNAQNGPATSGGAGDTGARQQLNLFLLGVSYDIPIINEQIALTPYVSSSFNLHWVNIGVKGSYYFDKLLKLPAAWDVYAGVSVSYESYLGSDTWYNNGNSYKSGLGSGILVGGRWFWSEKWGVNLELAQHFIGYSSNSSYIGVTMRL